MRETSSLVQAWSCDAAQSCYFFLFNAHYVQYVYFMRLLYNEMKRNKTYELIEISNDENEFYGDNKAA